MARTREEMEKLASESLSSQNATLRELHEARMARLGKEATPKKEAAPKPSTEIHAEQLVLPSSVATEVDSDEAALLAQAMALSLEPSTDVDSLAAVSLKVAAERRAKEEAEAELATRRFLEQEQKAKQEDADAALALSLYAEARRRPTAPVSTALYDELRKNAEEERTRRFLKEERSAALARTMSRSSAASTTTLYDEMRRKAEEEETNRLLKEERLAQEERDAEMARSLSQGARPAPRPTTPDDHPY